MFAPGVEGIVVALVALAGATGFGLWRRHSDGRMHVVPAGADEVEELPIPAEQSEPLLVDGHAIPPTDHSVVPAAHRLAADELGAPLGSRATLVQFSSAFCQPCRATRVVLADVARLVPGVTHVEVDAESHLDLVRRLDVTRTPTVLVLDDLGRIRNRATGAPRRDDVVAALGSVIA